MVNDTLVKVDGLLFDKDGTLFDFHGTWNSWAADVIEELSDGSVATMAHLAKMVGFDLTTSSILPDSIAIAGTHRQVSEVVANALPDSPDVDEIEQYLSVKAAAAPLAPAVPLVPFLAGLAGQGLRLGVMTNDSEFGARAHLTSAGIETHFDFIAGFDSGFGAKPAPDPLLAFAHAHDLRPGRVAMVGDSTHDLMAGRAAGMQTIGVLTGPAKDHDLAPFADVILPDIGHIPNWLAA